MPQAEQPTLYLLIKMCIVLHPHGVIPHDQYHLGCFARQEVAGNVATSTATVRKLATFTVAYFSWKQNNLNLKIKTLNKNFLFFRRNAIQRLK